MFPEFNIGNITVDTYTLNQALIVLISFIIAIIFSFLNKMKIYKGILVFLLILIFGFAGGKLLYSIENNVWTFKLNQFYINGALALLPLVPFIFYKLLKIDLYKFLGLTAIISSFFVAQAKVGCFLAGCCGGYESEFGLVFKTNPYVKIFPIQLVQFIIWYIVLIITLIIYKNKKLNKFTFPTFFFLYNFSLFITEIFMDNHKLIIGLTIAQLVALGYSLISIVWIIIQERINRKKLL